MFVKFGGPQFLMYFLLVPTCPVIPQTHENFLTYPSEA
jgi:hypothetical protein